MKEANKQVQVPIFTLHGFLHGSHQEVIQRSSSVASQECLQHLCVTVCVTVVLVDCSQKLLNAQFSGRSHSLL
ncbi:hypothetical protein LDENG_00249590 [Lucifuga dentata]|nr:hypothetical protein LDENG_00249590 [Lucifuga dentata]